MKPYCRATPSSLNKASSDLRKKDTGMFLNPQQMQSAQSPVMPQAGMDLMEFWRIISQRKWHIVLLAVFTALVALAVSMAIAPVYRATAVVMIEANKAKVISSIEEVYAGGGSNREFFQTQAEILKSREVAIKAIEKLKLWDHPDFDPRKVKPPFYQPVLDALGFAQAEKPEWIDALLADAVYGRIAGGKLISIEPVRLSQLVKVSFDAKDPELAAQMANTIAEAFIDNDREARFKMTQQAHGWLQERLKDLRITLSDSENRLQQYREREGLIELESDKQGGVARLIDAVTQRLIEAKLKTSESRNNYVQIKNAKPEELLSLPRIINNAVIMDAHRQVMEGERKNAELAQRYGPEHPKMVQAMGELVAAREQLNKAISMVVAGAQYEYEVAQATEKNLEETLARAKGGVQMLNKKEFGLAVLEREVATNRQLYDMFMNRAKETNAAQDMQSSIGRIVDTAQVPNDPIKPKKAMNVAVALVLGLLLGVGGVLLQAKLDNTLKSSTDVETHLHQPLLASLPELDKAARQSAGKMLMDEPHSLYAEAIRTARTGVLLSALDAKSRTLLVTSSVPGEGKTTFASNLALAHAQTKKTLLIDADMRKPSVASKLELDPHHIGLSELVAGEAGLDAVLQAIPETGLQVISAGTLPPNPLELLLSKRFAETLSQLQTQFDVIVIDSPPVELVSDALVLAPHCTSVIYMARAQETPIPVMKKGLAKLARANAPLLGVVLNHVEAKQQGYYGYGAGAYGHYGYGHAQAKATAEDKAQA